MDANNTKLNSSFEVLIEMVRTELTDTARSKQAVDRTSAELSEVSGQISGLNQSLGNPRLDSQVRTELETELKLALQRRESVQARLNEVELSAARANEIVREDLIRARLERLAEILDGTNANAANIVLAQHIDRIDCYRDGKVVMKTSKLGALAGATDLLRDPALLNPSTNAGASQPGVWSSKPRRRSGLKVTDPNDAETVDAAYDATRPDRFAGLAEKWFWEDVFQAPDKRPWSEIHAVEVARCRAEHQLSHEKLAKHFGVCKPTIGRALKIAEELGEVVDHRNTRSWGTSSKKQTSSPRGSFF